MKGRLQKALNFRALKTKSNTKNNELLSYKLIIARVRAKSMARIDSIGTVERNSNLSFIKLDFNKMIKYIKQKRVKMSFSMFKFFSKKNLNIENKPLKNNNIVSVINTNFTKDVKVKQRQTRARKQIKNETIKRAKQKINKLKKTKWT